MPESFSHSVSIFGGGQANFSQCWLASFRMLYKFYNLDVGSIETKISGTGIDLEDSKKNGLIDKEYNKAAMALGLKSWSGTLFKAPPSWYDVGLSDGCEAFLKELKEGPLWVSRYVEKGMYHAVLAKGYNDRGKGYIIFNNPFPGPNDAIEDGTMIANVFVRHITSALGSVQGYRPQG